MKFNKWTLGLAAVGAVSLASAARADETKMSQVQTALSDTTISGYVDVAATWRPGTDQGPGGIFTPAYSYAQNDGFSLNAVDIAIDKPEDESPWAAGYHVEMMFGAQSPQGYYGIPNGLSLLRQAYLALRTPIGNSAIDWKIGVWDPIIGYESNSDPLNPNYTRSYGYTIEPVENTGIQGTYKVNDEFSVTAGVANSWSEGVGLLPVDLFHDGTPTSTVYESQKTYMGAIAFTAPDSAGWLKGATVNAGVVNGVDSSLHGTGSQTSWYVGATVPTPVSALKVGAAFDLHEFHTAGTDPSVWVLGLYSSYQINDKASLNVRGEYVKNDGAGFYGSNAEEFTATLQYNLWANVLSRVEFRWDHSETTTPFGYYTPRGNDFMLALNLIYQF